ncbi:hypothetical protein AU476_08980 [Cupriavidus sp. UYMSc13B]|nr:hypothetical protein AU476_08980 [Cupriavidus sp. UYMSc13B]
MLAEGGKAVAVRRGEHFLHELVDVVCAAAPIYDCHDRLIGVLDITGFGVDLPPYALSHVRAAAVSIGNRTFERLPGCCIVRLHHDRRMLHTPAEGIVAVSADGVIVAANRIGCQMLQLSSASLGTTDIGSVFAEGSIYGPAGAMQAVVRTAAGARLHISTSETSRPRSAARARVAPQEGDAMGQLGGHVIADATLARVFEKASMAVCEQVPVILLGETGTGKSMLARALHESSRPDGDFVSINCSAIPEGLAEASCSAMPTAPLPAAARAAARARSSRPTVARCFLTRSATCRWHCRRGCSACCRSVASHGRCQQAGSRRYLGHLCHPPQPAGTGQAGRVPRRPVFSRERHVGAHPGAA